MVPGTGLLFGLMLLAAIVGGYAARLVRVPRVVGFLAGGVALRAALDAMLSTTADGDAADRLQAAFAPLGSVKDLALGLILFTIGRVFERSALRSAGPRVLKISLAQAVLCFLFVFAACAAAALVLQPGHGVAPNLIFAGLLALAAIATAPAVTLFVLQEYDAKGPMTDSILGVTGLNNLVCIVLFHTVFLILAGSGAIHAAVELQAHAWLGLTAATVGSIALGIVCGTLISLIHARLPLGETVLIFFALFILLGAGEGWLLEHKGISFNFLLTALIIGAVFANAAMDSQKLETSIRTVGSPIFAGFFVMAGYELHLDDLARMGWLGAAFVTARIAGKLLGTSMGLRWAGVLPSTSPRLGSALLCQGAVVIGLAYFVTRHWQHELAGMFARVILGSVVVFELIGPLLVKRTVVQAGEVKAITLLRRGGSPDEGGPIAGLMLRSVLGLFGLRRRLPGAGAAGVMQVRHIMRTNVQFLRAADTLDAVLHFIERSTNHHFPVVNDDNTFAGVIHFSDVRDVIYDPIMGELVTAIDLADTGADVVPMDMPLEGLLETFHRLNVGVLPVVEQAESKRIIGIVEQRDLLIALHRYRPAN